MTSSRTRLLLTLGLLCAAGSAAAQTSTVITNTTIPASQAAPAAGTAPPPTAQTLPAQTLPAQTMPAPSVGTTGTTAGGVEVGTLGDVTPDYGGTLEEGGGGFPIDMWKGTDRALVERLLPQLPAAASSPAMRDLTRRLLLSNAEAPAGKSGGVNLFGARADRLRAMGLSADAAALLALQPARNADALSARQRIDALLLAGDVDGACKAVDDTRKLASGDAAWQEAQVFCQLRAGQNDRAALGLDLLREQKQEDPAFFTLVDILGGNQAAKLDSLPAPTALDLAMLRAAHMPIPRDAAQVHDPAVLAMIARDASIDAAIRLAAAEQAAAAGSLPIDQLQMAYASVPYAPGDLGNAIEVSSHDPGPGSRAMLFQAAGTAVQTAQRAHILQAALDRARRQGGYLLAIQANLQFLLPLTPADDLIWFAADAGRGLYASGHFEQANAWLALAERRAASDPQAAAAVSSLAVYARIAGVGQPLAWDGAAVEKWRKAQAANNPAGDPAANRRIGETVLLALYALGPDGPGGVNPILLSRAISSLRQIGLDAEARGIAIEAAIAAGV